MDMTRPVLWRRAHLGWLCHARRFVSAVEIGTDRGAFADEFMACWANGVQLWTVDPYLPYSAPGIPGMKWDRDSDRIMAACLLSKWTPRVRMLRCTSVEAASIVPDPVQFVYLDGQHDRENVRLDIATWWERLSPGGVMAGHDYHHATPDVIAEVDAFVAREGLELNIIPDYATPASWWVVKP